MKEETEQLFLYHKIHLHKCLPLINPDFEKSLKVALSSVHRWTPLQQEKKCQELVIAFTGVMLSRCETRYSKSGKKVLSSNGFDKVMCIVIIF